jgi:hypothetical protein
MAVDEELGLIYQPVETPTNDYYGGHRPGNDLYAESLVCLDLKTGQRKWFYQVVHHPLWDFEISSAPILADINVNGRAVKAIALPSKQAFLYVFDRVTGQPVWPFEERKVPQTDVPGEKSSPTQPFPTKPPALLAPETRDLGPHRLRPGPAQGSRRDRFEIQDWPRLHAAGSQQSRWSDQDSGTRPFPGWHELARRSLRSRDSHRVRFGIRTGNRSVPDEGE